MKAILRMVRLALLCLAPLTFLMAAEAGAQTMEAVTVDGTAMKLLIPSGHCKVIRETPIGKLFYEQQERVQSGNNRVLLLFADCGELDRFNKGGKAAGFASYGMYLAPLAKGNISKVPAGMSRAQVVAELAKGIPALNADDVSNQMKPRLDREGATVSKMVLGSLGTDANGVYFGLAANYAAQQAATPASRAWCVGVLTVINQIVVSMNLYGAPDAGAPFQKLLAVQKKNAALLISAN